MTDDEQDQEQSQGIACPNCGCAHLPVAYTRQQNGHIMRVRACRHCGRRIKTRERFDGEVPPPEPLDRI